LKRRDVLRCLLTVILVVIVPEGIEVEHQKRLSGEHSAAQDVGSFQPWESRDKEYWYVPSVPAKGWTAIPDVPDPDRKAE